MNLWLVGQHKPDVWCKWEWVGVFDSEEKAVSACRNGNYFLSPLTLNEVAPDASVPAPDGSYFPRVGENA